MTVVRTQGTDEMGVAPKPAWVEHATPSPARMTPRAKSAARRRRSKTSFSTGDEAALRLVKGSFAIVGAYYTIFPTKSVSKIFQYFHLISRAKFGIIIGSF